MSRVTFYLLQQQSAQAVKQFACRLTDKAWRSGMSVHIHTENDIQCETMDRLLWTWRENSFLPHQIINSQTPAAPITLSFGPPASLHDNTLLINLSSSIPAFYQQFVRTCEIVDQSPGPVEILRDKFRAYVADGIQPETHRI